MKNHLVISALGDDRPGIVEQLSGTILECGCRIADSRMLVLGGEFGVILMASGNWNTIAKLEVQLAKLSQTLSLNIATKRTEAPGRKTDVLPYAVEVVGLDQPATVHSLAGFFANRSINIEELVTRGYNARHSNTPMLTVNLEIGIPASTHIAMLREEFMDFCDSLNLDAVMEPVKG